MGFLQINHKSNHPIFFFNYYIILYEINTHTHTHSKNSGNSYVLAKELRKAKRSKWTHPMSHITAPTMAKINASKAKGSPNKNPNGLQSPIIFLSEFVLPVLEF
jgi:hypothetical protein